jgi:predicted transcriptional regulator
MDTGIRILPKTETKNEQTENLDCIGGSVAKAATRIGVSERTIWDLAKTGIIRTTRIGRRCIFSVQSLRDFVDGTQEPCNFLENSNESQGETE